MTPGSETLTYTILNLKIYFCPSFLCTFTQKECEHATKILFNNKTTYLGSQTFMPAKKILHNRLWWWRHLEGLVGCLNSGESQEEYWEASGVRIQYIWLLNNTISGPPSTHPITVKSVRKKVTPSFYYYHPLTIRCHNICSSYAVQNMQFN